MQGYTYEKTIEMPNLTARIFRPVLTEDEKEKRIKAIKKAAADLVRGVKK